MDHGVPMLWQTEIITLWATRDIFGDASKRKAIAFNRTASSPTAITHGNHRLHRDGAKTLFQRQK
jgi:hypothetical protein